MWGPGCGAARRGQALRSGVVIFFPVKDNLFTGERVYFALAEFARQVPAARPLLKMNAV